MPNFLVFVFGLAIGSFLNVLIARLPEKESILGWSKCQNCKIKIPWYDLIPLLSFFLLKGHCRNCKKRISLQYPVVELTTGLLFLLFFLLYKIQSLLFIYLLFLASLLIVIAFLDFKKFLILDELIITGFLISIFFLYLLPYPLYFQRINFLSPSLKDSFLGIAFFAGVFFIIFLLSGGRAIGFGDVKLSALIGFIFGFKNSINIFYLTFFLGFIFAIILLVLRKATLKSKIPLGTLIASVTIFFLLTKFNILDWINNLSGDLIYRILK